MLCRKGESSNNSKGTQQEQWKAVTLRSGKPLASLTAKAETEGVDIKREKTEKEKDEEEKIREREKDWPIVTN